MQAHTKTHFQPVETTFLIPSQSEKLHALLGTRNKNVGQIYFFIV